MKKILFSILALAILALASCSKKTQESATATVQTSSDLRSVVTKVNATRHKAQQVTGKLSLDLSAAGKSASISGNVKMKRDDVIQISLQLLGLLEVGRIEMTQDYMLVLDRHDKIFVKAAYQDIPFFKSNQINFFTFQSLMWNELFVPGADNKIPGASNFAMAPNENGNTVQLTNSTQQVAIKFLANAASGVLQSTSITPLTGKGNLNWEYTEWSKLNSRNFPSNMSVRMNINNMNVKASMKLSKLRTDEKWKETRTEVSTKKYKQVTIQQAFNQIMNLAN